MDLLDPVDPQDLGEKRDHLENLVDLEMLDHLDLLDHLDPEVTSLRQKYPYKDFIKGSSQLLKLKMVQSCSNQY